MKISMTLMLMSAALIMGGTADGALGRIGVSRCGALFFLFAEAALDRFKLSLGYYAELSAACVFVSACVTVIYLRSEKSMRKALETLLFGIALGVPAFVLSRSGAETGIYAAAFICALLTPVFGLRRGAAVSALAPVSASAAACLASASATGLFELSITETCLSMQNAGLMLAFAASALTRRIALKKQSFQKL